MRLFPRHTDASVGVRRGAWRAGVRALLASVLFCVAPSFCSGQSHDVLCNDGYGKFEVKFTTGVTVRVGPAKNGELSRRVCEATLTWDKQSLSVVSAASQVDIDVLGVDLGLGQPVVAFQTKKKSDLHSYMKYEIYSLRKPPRLLRTINGGDFFGAADTDLDGRIEIWTGDASAVDGFEGLTPDEFDFAPTLALRFEHHRLVDVSSEFRPRFDDQVAEVRARLDSQDLTDFKNSDGKLSGAPSLSTERLPSLRRTKIQILEIVWSYLNSGREQLAWHALAEMWPAADLERIRAALRDSQDGGIRGQVDDVSPGISRLGLRKFAYIYDAVNHIEGRSFSSNSSTADVLPQPILLMRPPPSDAENALPNAEESLDLVVDAAGKVRSAKAVGAIEPELINATARWKFIPAFKEGRPVACRLRFAVTPLR